MHCTEGLVPACGEVWLAGSAIYSTWRVEGGTFLRIERVEKLYCTRHSLWREGLASRATYLVWGEKVATPLWKGGGGVKGKQSNVRE